MTNNNIESITAEWVNKNNGAGNNNRNRKKKKNNILKRGKLYKEDIKEIREHYFRPRLVAANGDLPNRALSPHPKIKPSKF